MQEGGGLLLKYVEICEKIEIIKNDAKFVFVIATPTGMFMFRCLTVRHRPSFFKYF